MYQYVIIGARPPARMLARRLAVEMRAPTLLLSDRHGVATSDLRTTPQPGLNLRTVSCFPSSSPLAHLRLPPLDPLDAERWNEGLGAILALDAAEIERGGDALEERDPHPLGRAFVRAGIEAGLPFAPWHSRKTQVGVTLHPLPVDRPSTPPPSPEELTIFSDVHVRRLRLDGTRVRSVVFEHGARSYEVDARHVFLCGGALRNPHLLFASGIGASDPATRAPASNFQARFDDIGRGLVDALYVPLRYHSPQTTGRLTNQVLSWFSASAPQGVVAHALLQSPLAENGPDLLLLLSTEQISKTSTYTIYVVLLHPRSRGSVAPGDIPVVNPRFLKNEQDMQALLYGLKLARRMAETRSLGAHTGRLLEPRPRLVRAGTAGMRTYVREAALPGGCFTGTCRAGPDASSPVDSDLSLRHLEGIYLADASILPHPPRSSLPLLEELIAKRAVELMLP